MKYPGMGNGLRQGQRKILGVIISSLIGLTPVLVGLSQTNSVQIPGYVYMVLGLAAFIAYNIKNEYGIKADVVAAESGPKQ